MVKGISYSINEGFSIITSFHRRARFFNLKWQLGYIVNYREIFEGEKKVLRRYFSVISMLLFSLFIYFGFVSPIVVNGTSEFGDKVIISLIITSFLTALFSQKGKLRIFAIIISVIPVLFLLGLMLLPIFYIV